ncbi:uncharacterized protein LOC113234294 [Hyposmocoma kahamanoa]|uniref:uncharacterized protein LOC113234294 n=1 Tax=Hyposmocoma kahamanoa TaxID=1477025 RepID=UPI000E6D6E7D|nr:uncharacterized protein LOC113234294 [Hyposmocoma kahamanoa]
MDSFQAISADEETRRLMADNKRMKRELATLRAEVTALRTAFSERVKPPGTGSPADPLHVPQGLQEIVEDLQRNLLVSLGEMINVRLGEIEKRLPPEPILRRQKDSPSGHCGRRRCHHPQGASHRNGPRAYPGSLPSVKRACRPSAQVGQGPPRKAASAPPGADPAAPAAPGETTDQAETPWLQVVGRKAKKAAAAPQRHAPLGPPWWGSKRDP